MRSPAEINYIIENYNSIKFHYNSIYSQLGVKNEVFHSPLPPPLLSQEREKKPSLNAIR